MKFITLTGWPRNETFTINSELIYWMNDVKQKDEYTYEVRKFCAVMLNNIDKDYYRVNESVEEILKLIKETV